MRDNPVASTSLTHIDGERGLLEVAGYAVEEIAPRCSFEEACFLLLHRRLPDAAELEHFGAGLARARALPAGLWVAARQAAAERVAPMDALMILAALLRRPGHDLQTNVEFYTALLLHGIGLDRELFTPTFAVARVVGWLAHAAEQRDSNVLLRPRARYIGPRGRRWLPLADR